MTCFDQWKHVENVSSNQNISWSTQDDQPQLRESRVLMRESGNLSSRLLLLIIPCSLSTYTSAVQQTQDQLKHDGVVVVSVVNVEARDNRYVCSGMLGDRLEFCLGWDVRDSELIMIFNYEL